MAILYVILLLLTPLAAPEAISVWPKPRVQSDGDNYYQILPEHFSIQAPSGVQVLHKAVKRYIRAFFSTGRYLKSDPYNLTAAANLTAVQVLIDNTSIPLQYGVDETYELQVEAPVAVLHARTVWGSLRGLETFSQLIINTKFAADETSNFFIQGTSISDGPRFSWRGLLIDTSRHFLPLSHIFSTLEAMEWNKLNVLHWHIVDDPSFPFQSTALPLLSAKGAFHPSLIYTAEDISNVRRYAAERGIRVMVELDTPGHTASWGLAYPQLLSRCFTPEGKPTGDLGPIDPTQESSYEVLQGLVAELDAMFQDGYFHIGGDEVDFSCWESDAAVAAWMSQHNISSYGQLQGSFTKRVADIINGLGRTAVVWQEALDQDPHLPLEVVVQVWIKNAKTLTQDEGKHHEGRTVLGGTKRKGSSDRHNVQAVRAWREEMAFATARGHRVLLSAPWYLDQISWTEDWRDYYEVEPLEGLSAEQQQLVMGGEACTWGEFVDATNLLSRTWPRGSAVAERLWSAPGGGDMSEVAHRIDQHRCRMVARGIPAQPLFPSYCPDDNRHSSQP